MVCADRALVPDFSARIFLAVDCGLVDIGIRQLAVSWTHPAEERQSISFPCPETIERPTRGYSAHEHVCTLYVTDFPTRRTYPYPGTCERVSCDRLRRTSAHYRLESRAGQGINMVIAVWRVACIHERRYLARWSRGRCGSDSLVDKRRFVALTSVLEQKCNFRSRPAMVQHT